MTCNSSKFAVWVGGRHEYTIAGPCCVCDGGCWGDQIFLVVPEKSVGAGGDMGDWNGSGNQSKILMLPVNTGLL
jgi:hypothetical protein